MAELLIGCGNARKKQLARPGRKEWSGLVTLDLDPACRPDVVHDLNDLPYPFENNQFDEIHAYHVLEHCGRQGDWRFFFNQWAEFWRITKPGGTFHGICPHRNSAWAWGDPGHTRIIGLEQLTFLEQSRYAGVNNSNMTDYRHFYKANWLLVWEQATDDEQGFVLEKSES